MRDQESKQEPFFSDSENTKQSDHDPLFDSRQPPRDELDPRLRLAAIGIATVCALFVVDWGYDRYVEYRARQALNEMLMGLQETTEAATRSLQQEARASAKRRQALAEVNRQETERRRLALRVQRASTNQGKWLSKNCSDWRRAYKDLKAPTAKAEMKRHCDSYEKYLETGIAVTPVR